MYASPDSGRTWTLVADGLPPVVCVRAAVIGDPAKIRVPHARGARAKAPAKKSAKKTVKKKAVAKRPSASARKPARAKASAKKKAPARRGAKKAGRR